MDRQRWSFINMLDFCMRRLSLNQNECEKFSPKKNKFPVPKIKGKSPGIEEHWRWLGHRSFLCWFSKPATSAAYFLSIHCSLDRMPQTGPFPWSLRQCITRCTSACVHSLLNPVMGCGMAWAPPTGDSAMEWAEIRFSRNLLPALKQVENMGIVTQWKKSPLYFRIRKLLKHI